MNAKKAVFGFACVLALVVAAQPAQAQFITRAEREAIAQAAASFQNNKKADKKQEKQAQEEKQNKQQKQDKQNKADKKQKATPKATADFRLPGREMNMVYSSEYILDTACKISQACYNAVQKVAQNMVIYGPGGREGAAMRSGETLKHLILNKQKKAALKDQLKEQSDSMTKALEQADLKARQQADKK